MAGLPPAATEDAFTAIRQDEAALRPGVILGHNECGAIKAAVDVVTKNAQLPGHLPDVAHLKAPVEKAQKQEGSLVDNAIRQNVLLNVETLRNSGTGPC